MVLDVPKEMCLKKTLVSVCCAKSFYGTHTTVLQWYILAYWDPSCQLAGTRLPDVWNVWILYWSRLSWTVYFKSPSRSSRQGSSRETAWCHFLTLCGVVITVQCNIPCISGLASTNSTDRKAHSWLQQSHFHKNDAETHAHLCPMKNDVISVTDCCLDKQSPDKWEGTVLSVFCKPHHWQQFTTTTVPFSLLPLFQLSLPSLSPSLSTLYTLCMYMYSSHLQRSLDAWDVCRHDSCNGFVFVSWHICHYPDMLFIRYDDVTGERMTSRCWEIARNSSYFLNFCVSLWLLVWPDTGMCITVQHNVYLSLQSSPGYVSCTWHDWVHWRNKTYSNWSQLLVSLKLPKWCVYDTIITSLGSQTLVTCRGDWRGTRGQSPSPL